MGGVGREVIETLVELANVESSCKVHVISGTPVMGLQ